jgi:hypothetical protein
MTTNLQVNDQFPEITLPNHQNELTQLSHFTKPSLLDRHLGFLDGYPLILVFFRGFFCPRDQQQMRQLVEFQHELRVNYAKLVAVSADPPIVQAAFRTRLSCAPTYASTPSITGGTLLVALPMKNCDTICAPSCKPALITATRRTTPRRCVKSAFPSKNGLMGYRHWEPMAYR